MLTSIGDDSTARSGRAGRRPACGPVAGAGAAQTRQIVHPDARDWGLTHLVGKASDWLKEERRKTLGDWVSVCLSCGYAQRYFEDWEAELPPACPQCSGEMRWRCPSCDARFTSAFTVECEACGGDLRPRELFGTPIRKPGR